MKQQARLKSLRLGVPGDKIEPTELAEGLRDLWTVIAQRVDVRVVEMVNFAWTPPFLISADRIPAAILLGRASLSKSPVPVNGTSFVSWTWQGSAARVDEVQGMTIGENYDLAFVLIG